MRKQFWSRDLFWDDHFWHLLKDKEDLSTMAMLVMEFIYLKMAEFIYNFKLTGGTPLVQSPLVQISVL